MYADDMQVYGHCQPDQTECLSVRISNCVDAISDWMFSRCFQLNASKTEVMWCSSGRRAPELFQIGRHLLRLDPVSTICPQPLDLAGLRLFHNHIHQQNNSEIRSIAAPFSFDVRKLLLTSFVLSKIDCGNSTLVGLPTYRLE